jgi:PBP1b-binding outer membrane lipoprotein LpoB
MRYLLLTLMILGLCGCPQEREWEPPAAEKEQVDAEASKNQNDTQLRDTIQAPIEKANAVEDQVLEAAEQQRADIEAETD